MYVCINNHGYNYGFHYFNTHVITYISTKGNVALYYYHSICDVTAFLSTPPDFYLSHLGHKITKLHVW